MTFDAFLREHKRIPETRNLLLSVKNWSLTDLLLHGNEEMPPDFLCEMTEKTKRLQDGEPVQYVTGNAPFFGRDFFVSPAVLIPRFDTEILVEAVLNQLSSGSLLDLCTGSGCIAVTLKAERPAFSVTASDVSEEALLVAERNAKRHGADVRFLKSDLFAEFSKGNELFDAIVSNPPYVKRAEIDTLDDCVKNHEPHLALDGDLDGLSFYRRIVREAPGFLKENGRIFLEIGCDEAGEVTALCETYGFTGVRVLHDLAGLPRVVVAERGEKKDV